MIKEMIDYWPLFLGGIAVVSGYAELKSKSKGHSEDIKDLARRMSEQRKEDLARTESMLGEIRGDVKQLLQRGS